jgi:hypothetical protein
MLKPAALPEADYSIIWLLKNLIVIWQPLSGILYILIKIHN